MPRNSLFLLLTLFALIAAAPSLGQDVSKRDKPVPTFEDSVRADLVDSRATFQATTRFLRSQQTRGYISATLWCGAGIGAMAMGVGPVAFVLVGPGVVSGVLQGMEAGKIQKVVYGADPYEGRRRPIKRDYD